MRLLGDDGLPLALTVAGYGALTGSRVQQDSELARHLLVEAAEAGDLLAIRILALGAGQSSPSPLEQDEQDGWLLAGEAAGEPRCLEAIARRDGSLESWIEATRAGSLVAREKVVTRALEELVTIKPASESEVGAVAELVAALRNARDPFERPERWRPRLSDASRAVSLTADIQLVLSALLAVPGIRIRQAAARLSWIQDAESLLWDGPMVVTGQNDRQNM